ncbi:hypothetical protein BIW11_12323 [Tropilaelaps mercedesae]|uniref:Uncharacterized protein n=1 Tax=Tropilaelaps mercedesae TaxID=418985 RepID=A0A1V9X7G3_9ACAR|nr:hypothetical protein BIW11_12323 [Tropilaelaps mercedesae]
MRIKVTLTSRRLVGLKLYYSLFSCFSVRVYLAMWVSLFVLAFTNLAPEKHRILLYYMVLFVTMLEHGVLLVMVRGSEATPRIVWVSSAIVAGCVGSIAVCHISELPAVKRTRKFETALKATVPVFKLLLSCFIGLLGIVLVLL